MDPNAGAQDRGEWVMNPAAERLVVDLITENINRRKRGDTDPATGELITAPESIGRTLERTDLDSQNIEALLTNPEVGAEAVVLLASFASTAIEMWAMYVGKDPLDLVRDITSKWEGKADERPTSRYHSMHG
jgi:hypothetical protein